MTTPSRAWLAASLTLAGSLAPAALHAHPHVFAEASLGISVNPDTTVGTLKHLWRFDDLFSSTVLMEFDQNQDLKLDDTELEEVASTVHQSLAEYNYFQIVTVDGKDVRMAAPDRLIATFEDNQLTILFESKPAEPLRLAGKVAFGVYDPTFYTAIDFVEDRYMTVEMKPETCTARVVRPDPDEAIAQNQESLTEAFFDDPGGNDLSKMFATRLELDCAKGD